MIKIDIIIFSISLFIGLFLVYVTAPKPNIIFKYPTIKTANDIIYVDEKNTCYKYIPKLVNCSEEK